MKELLVVAGFGVAVAAGLPNVSAAQENAADIQPAPYQDTVPVAPDSPPPLPPAAEAGKSNSIQEVIVTARRTAESQQDVPVAVTSFNAESLAREAITNVQDLQGRVPSLVMSTGATVRNAEVPTIRGQGATFGGGSGVLVYYADAPLPADTTLANVGGPGKFFDLADMQVLKGSQGTLFGKNTTGGALVLQPHKPENVFSGYITAEGGNYGLQSYQGVINVPVIDDTLLLRAGALYYDREGYTKDVATGQDYDNRHYWTSHLGITWKPLDSVENYLFGYYTENHDNGSGFVMKGANPDGLNALLMSQLGLQPLPAVPAQLQPGCLIWDTVLTKDLTNRCGLKFVDEQAARDNRHVQLSADPTDNLKTGAAIDSLSIALNDVTTLRNIASYSILEHQYRWDHDGSRAQWTDFNLPNNENQTDIEVFTEELQLQGTQRDGLLSYTAGFYYEDQKPRGPENNQIKALYHDIFVTWHLKKNSYGPFAQATYDLGDIFAMLDGLKLTAGARYSKDESDGASVFTQQGTDYPAAGDVKSSATTWTVGLDYKLGKGRDATLLYGKVSRGYKAGGFAITASNPDHLTFKPEYVLNYELGQKSDFRIGSVPARINTAVYYTDYTDMQRNGVDVYDDPSTSGAPRLGNAIFNAGKATIEGAELEATVLPFAGASLIANYSYTRAKYDEYELVSGSAAPQLDCTGQLKPQGETLQLSCAPFLYTPKNQYSVTAMYDVPFDPAVGDVSASVTWAWTEKNYTSATTLPAAEPGAWIKSIGLLNANISWQNILRSQLSLQVFGTNLLDKEYIMANDNVWTTLYFRSVLYGEPRMVGARLSYRWGV